MGGGRYDGLIKNLGGRDLSATGFALGIDRLADIVKLSKLNPSILPLDIFAFNKMVGDNKLLP